MKKMNLKSALLLTAVAVMLLVAVGGTVAYLTDRTEEVTNTFTPSDVETEIIEDFNGSVKKSIVISNASNSIDVYIRVALVGNWVNNADEIIRPWEPEENMPLGNFWVKYGDYYYYTKPVAPGNSTSNLLGLKDGNQYQIQATPTESGETLEVTVIQQAIQAEPSDVVQKTWGVIISEGSVTKYVAQ